MSRYYYTVSVDADSQDESEQKIADIVFAHPELGRFVQREKELNHDHA